MKLHELKSLLRRHPRSQFRLDLPMGTPMPVSFHVTEVGRVEKKFIDCGGTVRETVTCQLQVWVGGDDDHRLETGKMARILEKAGALLPDETVSLEIEYEDEVISQYTIARHRLDGGAVVLELANKHTDCLAKETCGARAEPSAICCSGTGGCGR